MSNAMPTPEALLASAAQHLRKTPFDEIAYRDLADDVGVSERTVYRHFPTRSHLLAELGRHIENSHFPIPAFAGFDEFEAAVIERFRAFEEAPGFAHVVARASTISPVSTSVDPERASFFAEAVRILVADRVPGLNRRDARRLCATLTHVSSAQFWVRCRSGFGMDARATAEVFRNAARAATGRFVDVELRA